jgi:hypothetical protein
LIQTIATLTYEAYSCAGGRAYFGKASQERVFCELFARLIFDRMRKHKSKRIEIFLGNERAGLRDALQGVVSSCVHSINASHRGQVGFPPVIHTIKRGDGCLELTRYVAAVVRQQLERGEFEPAERRDYRRIESKVRLIRRLETDEFFSRRHPLPD